MANAHIVNGKAHAEQVIEQVTTASQALLRQTGIQPGIAVVIVGADPASQIYVRSKGRKAEQCGFLSRAIALPDTVSEMELLAKIMALNDDPAIHGILVQLPLPDQISERRIIEAIVPDKDVDGFHPINVGLLHIGHTAKALIPCTPMGCLHLIKQARGADLSGLSAVVLGRSNIVGKPMAALLLQNHCTVTIAHSRTRDGAHLCQNADIVVAAMGQPQRVGADWIKPGATVIDVGMNRIDAPERCAGQTRLVGDVHFDTVAEVAGAITPVPGGVGPMTIAMLMANTLTAAARTAGMPELAPQF